MFSLLPNTSNGFPQDNHVVGAYPISFGVHSIDDALGGGLFRSGVHEIYAATRQHVGAATGFASAMALRAARGKPILWVRQDFLDIETGILNGSGFAELGLDPQRIILVRARDVEGVLRAGEQAARCAELGVVVMEPWGEPKILNFTASRRLSLASVKSGVPIVMLRAAAAHSQSAAATRWSVQSASSRALEANAPGFPAFELSLLRRRGGSAGHVWRVEWNRDQKCFQDRQRSGDAPLSRPVVPISRDRSAESGASIQGFRKAG